MRFLKFGKTNQHTDKELILQFRSSGENSCLGVLFERYSHLVFGVCLKYLKDEDESKDAVIQIFEKLMEDLKKHEIENFKSWLHSVARNFCLMQLRKKQSATEKESEYKRNEPAVVDFEPASHLNNDHSEIQLNMLEDALKLLATEQRTCVELFYLQEKCYNEIVVLTGYSLNQVKSYIQNGKRNLKNILSKKNEEFI
jgi:RNA polymerase sigma factor (sigma-70 family)